jgi:hypothetical protein
LGDLIQSLTVNTLPTKYIQNQKEKAKKTKETDKSITG